MASLLVVGGITLSPTSLSNSQAIDSPGDHLVQGAMPGPFSLASSANLFSLAVEGDVVATSQRLVAHQLERAGFAWDPAVDVPNHRALREAVLALLDLYGQAPGSGETAWLDDLAALPGPVTEGVLHVLNAFLAYRAATLTAQADSSAAAGSRLPADPSPVFAARQRLFERAMELVAMVGGDPGLPIPSRASSTDCVLGDGLVLAISYPVCDDVYEGDHILIIDFGGNDTYLNNAGGSGVDWFTEPCDLGTVAALIDVQGRDQYGDPDTPRSCGVNGGAHGAGAGFLVDGEPARLVADAIEEPLPPWHAADRYYGKSFGVNGGASTAGIGFLFDQAGHDAYHGPRCTAWGAWETTTLGDFRECDAIVDGDFGVNGGSYNAGAGFLLDGGGADVYGDTCTLQYLWARNGVVGGVCWEGDPTLAETSDLRDPGYGWDDASCGFNGGVAPGSCRTDPVPGLGAPCGMGALVDLGSGNDRYTAGDGFWGPDGPEFPYANGGSCGILVDYGGYDWYYDGGLTWTETQFPNTLCGSTCYWDPFDVNSIHDSNAMIQRAPFWLEFWQDRAQEALDFAVDPDVDGLKTLDEFKWGLVPICMPPLVENCEDYDDDGWLDGPEVTFWNNSANDHELEDGQDDDRRLDTDADGRPNVLDRDSDGDGLRDGLEFYTYGTYPEFVDSDCHASAVECTASSDSTFHDPQRVGAPGTGDGLNDSVELALWEGIASGAWNVDLDGDGITNNLLDPDAEGDGLLDGEEWLSGEGQVRPDLVDTDADGVTDGDEVAWNLDTDGDGNVNANDADSDADGMPDGWEAEHGFNMVDPTDAQLDRDGDGLTNLGEYLAGTDPNDMDTEDDLLLDGEEVLTYGTDPLWWDSDADAMPDRFEVTYGLDPLDPADAAVDADLDSFDQDNDGTPELAWTNLQEYQYGRAPGYDEELSGPWLLGTNPQDADSDKDGATDGYEAYFGTNAMLPADGDADHDDDGLNWTREAQVGTDPNDADTDGDGLCDGGRAANCTFPGAGTTGFRPGEADYGSIPWDTDSDADGIPDGQEAVRWDPGAAGTAHDVDGDLLNGVIDPDSDNDGLPEGEEVNVRLTDPANADTDTDGLTDGDEVHFWSTNPKDDDHDNDGLRDGDEVNTHRTRPTVADTDGDGLNDGAEVTTHATSPLLEDTDLDGLPDAWEVQMGTLANVADADQDPDVDEVPNAQEYALGLDPRSADSDGDGMPDGYEVDHGLDPDDNDAVGDLDLDGLNNKAEHDRGTLPGVADTDGDRLSDGSEVSTYATDPLKVDTDDDGLEDGDERDHWIAQPGASWNVNYDGDAGGNNLRDVDSDNDGLTDYEEFVTTKTKPHAVDSDGDSISDRDEVVTYRNRFDANKADTDGDGFTDDQELALDCAECDDDFDGINNGHEVNTYGTNPFQADSDCDGIEEGPERNHWNNHGGWNAGVNRLLTADVDGDTIKDGVELGVVGTPKQGFYKTNPLMADTDVDGLRDDEEAVNNVRVSCGAPQTMSSSSAGVGTEDERWLGDTTTPLPLSVPGLPLGAVAASTLLQDALDPGVLYLDAAGFTYGSDEEGLYVQGAFGVRLHLTLPPSHPPGTDATSTSMMTTSGPGTNGKFTDPTLPDTDGDGLGDGAEIFTYDTDPLDCDSDDDRLGDGVEVGRAGVTRDTTNPCTHRDSDPLTTTDPNAADTDGDGARDGPSAKGLPGEDQNANGLADGAQGLTTAPYLYCGGGGESDAADTDTDDDGLLDLQEIGLGLKFLCYDTDLDGLSDGLESGVTTSQKPADTTQRLLFGTLNWPTWQPYEGSGATTQASGATQCGVSRDTDCDGLIDGLEDLNHNGKFGLGDFGVNDWSSLLGRVETSPRDKDSENDGLADGREVLVHGTYTFADAVQKLAPSFAQLTYDDANPWETKVTVPDTDGDGFNDGRDLNPRADAFLAFSFVQFRMQEKADCCGQHDLVEVYLPRLHVELPLGLGAFDFSMNGNEAVAIPESTTNPQLDFDELVLFLWSQARDGWPSGLPAGEDSSSALEGASNALRLNIPDDGLRPTSLDNLQVVVEIDARDEDPWNADDILDLNPDSTTERLRHVINLAGDPRGAFNPSGATTDLKYLAWGASQEHKGDLVKGGQIKDAWLRATSGDSIPSYVLDGLKQVRGPAGVANPLDRNCWGETSCV